MTHTQQRGRERRDQIVAFVRRFQSENGHGPRTGQIEQAVGYRGHGIRERHLERLGGRIAQRGARWEVVE